MSRIVYTTGDTVTIDYDETLRLFLTQQEHLSFSAEKLLRMLNRKSREVRVCHTGVGLHISVGEACCILTHRATSMLASLYQRDYSLQVEFPYLHGLFGEQVEGMCS